jgi:hypothetical protein
MGGMWVPVDRAVTDRGEAGATLIDGAVAGKRRARRSCCVPVVLSALAGLAILAPVARTQNVLPDSTGVIVGKLVERQSGQPVPYGTVLLVGTDRARFADSGGAFALTRLTTGAYHLRARQIGYSPTDTTVEVHAGLGATSVTLHMTKIALSLAAIEVQGRRTKGCVATGVPDSTVNAGLAAAFAQVRENVDRFRLALDEYPFRYQLEERAIMRREPGGDSTERTDTVSYESRDRRAYRIGHVVYDEMVPLGPSRRMMYLPTFRDLADPTFLDAHCFSFGGAQKLDKKSAERVLRVDFRPAESIASPDVEGSVFLDADRYIIRRAVFRLTKPETLDPPLVSVTVTSTYRELLPLVPVLDAFETVLPLLPTTAGTVSGASRAVDRTEITDFRLIGYAFESRTPGDQPAVGGAAAAVTASAMTPAPSGGGQVTSIEGRVLRADGTPVEGAAVGVLASGDSTATSDSGHFILRNLTPGAHMVWVHGVGFQPTRVAVTLSAASPRPLTITVVQAAPVLAPIVTTAKMPPGYADVGLDKRMQAGIGRFLTYEQIVHRQATNLSQLLQGMPGIQLSQESHSFGTKAGGTRGPGSCVAYVVDGVAQTQIMDRTAAGMVTGATGGQEQSKGAESPDHLIDPSSIGAIEVYSSGERPQGFGTVEERPLGSSGDGVAKIDLNAQQCVLVMIWSRSRLGLTDSDSTKQGGGVRAASTGGSGTPAPRTTGTAAFPTMRGKACHQPSPFDTVRVNVYAALESGLDSPDSAWLHYSERVLSAFRQAFVLPSHVALPAFGYAYPALTAGSLKPRGMAVAPTLSSVVVFTLDPTGVLLNSRVGASSLAGEVDTSVLAAVQAAASTHAFPAMPATPGLPKSARFDVTVTTTTPAAEAHAAVVDQIDVPEWLLTRPVALEPASYAALMATVSTPGTPAGSATFELVVDENGQAVMSTVRAISQTPGGAADPTDRGFVARIAHLLPSFRFDPAMIGPCPVRQIILQPFANQ